MLLETDRPKLTGYPHIDRPWRQYYNHLNCSEPLPEGSVYEYMHSCNNNRMDCTAMRWFDRKIKHGEFDKRINQCAQALYAYGVRQGNIVSLCMLTTPETLILFYAINKIGAVANFLVINAPDDELRKEIELTDSRLCFVTDMAINKVKSASEGTSLKKIIGIPLWASMPLFLKAFMRMRNRNNDEEWKEFLNAGIGVSVPDIIIKSEDLAVLEFTSGTTGESKPCMLSNKAINSVAWQDIHSQGLFDLQKGQTVLASLPPFIAFGLVTTLCMPLAVGLELILTPDPSSENVGKMVVRYRPNHIVGSPGYVDEIINAAKKLGKTDMTFLSSICVGGDKIDPSWEKRVNEWLSSHGSMHHLVNGYGLTETAATFCWETDVTDYLIPLYHNNVMIIDPETQQALKYDQTGEICVSGPSLMNGYFKNEKATDELFFERDGVCWMRTGDLGAVRENGAFEITGRIKRIYWGMGDDKIAYRIYPMAIEEVISSCDGVEHCAVVGVRNGNQGYLPVAFIVSSLIAEHDSLTVRIKETCKNRLKPNSQPHSIIFIDALPTTRAGKTDFKKLEQEAEKTLQ